MTIVHVLLILLIFIAIFIIRSDNNLVAIISFSVFSLISASLYYFLKAPDLALAEAAIGSAIIPLIYIIAISRQEEFLVVSHISEQDDFLSMVKGNKGKGYKLLRTFTKYYKLKLVIKHRQKKNDEFRGIFRTENIDLIIEKSNEQYLLKGKKTSILMNKLEYLIKDDNHIKIVRVEEGETDD